jgi:hypothetical protein
MKAQKIKVFGWYLLDDDDDVQNTYHNWDE